MHVSIQAYIKLIQSIYKFGGILVGLFNVAECHRLVVVNYK